MTAKVLQLPGLDFAPTDIGNADLFKHVHRDYAKHVTGLGWMIFDGLRWQPDTSNQILILAKQTVTNISDLEWRAKSGSRGRLNAMIALAEPEMTIDADKFDRDPWLFNCIVGTVDLRTGELFPHDSKQLITKLSELEYDPEAEASLWDEFLQQILPDDDLRAYVQRAIGYSLTGRVDEQCLFFALGKGRNGKSVFLETLQAVVGDYGCNTTTNTVMKKSGGIPNDIARLRGFRFVTLNETGRNQNFDEPLLKDLTGSDTVTARFLFKKFFDFKPAFKLWFRGNHQPIITGTDDGIWRRFHVIPFVVQIPEADVDQQLPDKLKNELQGILAWAVKGALQWADTGLKAPEIVTEAVQQYRKDSDVIGQFIEAHCIVGPEHKVAATLLYKSYRAFAKDNGEKVVSQTEFGRSLSNRGFKKKHSGITYRCGLTLEQLEQ